MACAPVILKGSMPLILDVSLSGRRMEVTSAALDGFKKLVEEHGITADAVILNQSNGKEKAQQE